MIQTKKYYRYIFNVVIMVVLILSSQGTVFAQPSLQNSSAQDSPPLFPGLNWEHSEDVEKVLQIKGQALTLLGDVYEASVDISQKKAVLKYYAPEYLEADGWFFLSDNNTDVVFENNNGQYLSVTNDGCSDSENYCLSVWIGNAPPVVEEDSFGPTIGPVGFNKISPANGATIPLPDTTWHVLEWTDALLEDNYPDDYYEYCIDTSNNNVCNTEWVARNPLYSGGTEEDPEFPLAAGVTYYWQVRTHDTLIYADGSPNAWWSFKFSAPVVGFNKITPTNNSIINMPNSTYRLLNWGDAFLDEGDEYQYCIDTTNDNACTTEWIDRESLYSGGDETVPPPAGFDFPLAYGQTYYWQVRSKNEPHIYANGNTPWWKFTIQPIVAAPTVTSIVRNTPTTQSTNAASVIFRITFSQAVTGVDITDFELTTTGFTVLPSITSVNGLENTNTRTVTVNTGTGSGTLRLDFIDNDTVKNFQLTPIAGVGMDPDITIGNFTTGQSYKVRMGPIVLSSVPATTATPGIIIFTVTFDEAVTGVDVTDFSLFTTGAVNGATINSVSATSTSVYKVTVDTGGAGAGTIRLDVIDDDTILNAALNPLMAPNGTADGSFTTGTVFQKSTFADVPVSGSPWSAYQTAIKSIFDAGITSGCGSGNYCPASYVTRAQMSTFILKGIHGGAYVPPAATGTVFNDVDITHLFVAWIEQFAAEGITSGCGGGNYCPENNVSRGQMAVFLLRADHGAAYVPPAATGTMFSDVPISHPFAAWIEQLAVQGVTSGCGGGNYCPNNAVNRAQMAVFLKKIFGLP